MSDSLRIYLGWDPREAVAYAVAGQSLRRHTSRPLDIRPIRLDWLRDRGWYRRPTEVRDGRLWDVISEAPMSTEHAIARFFVPHLQGCNGWALSADCDILARSDIAALFALADDRFALMVVQHAYVPAESVKMDGQVQTTYQRKNWSSVMLWNCAHPAHSALTLEVLNTWPGRDLHAFRWLSDDEIGALPATWNHLVGVVPEAALVHFTLGTPDMPGYEHEPYADEWRSYARKAVVA